MNRNTFCFPVPERHYWWESLHQIHCLTFEYNLEINKRCSCNPPHRYKRNFHLYNWNKWLGYIVYHHPCKLYLLSPRGRPTKELNNGCSTRKKNTVTWGRPHGEVLSAQRVGFYLVLDVKCSHSNMCEIASTMVLKRLDFVVLDQNISHWVILAEEKDKIVAGEERFLST